MTLGYVLSNLAIAFYIKGHPIIYYLTWKDYFSYIFAFSLTFGWLAFYKWLIDCTDRAKGKKASDLIEMRTEKDEWEFASWLWLFIILGILYKLFNAFLTKR